MRGLGQFQINQMKKGDPRVPQFFRELRSVLDLLEDMILHPHVELEQKAALAPRTVPPVVIERLPEKNRILDQGGSYRDGDQQRQNLQGNPAGTPPALQEWRQDLDPC